MLAVGLVLGLVLGWLLGRTPRAGQAGADPQVLQAQHAAAVSQFRHEAAVERAEVEQQLAAATASVEGLREQLVLAQDQHRQTIEAHRNEARQREASTQVESKVLEKLAPVAAQLKDMQQKVVDLEKQRHQQQGELTEQIRTTQASAEQSRVAAETLAAALSNNSTRGVWGETQLRTLVESAGLINRVDFNLQASIAADSGARRPDLVLNLPGGKSIAVDAKVPYNAYMEACAIPASAGADGESRRKQLLVQHAKQVRSHVDALAGKRYWTGLDASPEMTIAFIPNEPLLAAALEQDPTLMEYAFSKRIALASPVSLWAVIKTVAFTWQQDVLTEDAKQLFDLGKELYSRLATMAEHADKLRRSIESTVSNYNAFAGSLEQRVLVTARKLDALDESKIIGTPQVIEAQTRRLDQSEFAVLEETGIARPEIDLQQITLPGIADDDKRTG